jgi:DNA processing protein
VIEDLSQNTQAVLLLTAPLVAGRGKARSDLLTPGEYKKLARHLLAIEAQPADLLAADAGRLLADCQGVIDPARLEPLLGRGLLLSQAVEHWRARAIWVVGRADAGYPQRLKTRLKGDSPPLIYGCGERETLDRGGLAVVGSRHVDEVLLAYTAEVGGLVARAGRVLISGGARGVDQAAMRGCLEAGGQVGGVLADGLERAALQREHRDPLLAGRLVLISPYDPGAGFNVGHAMQRNKVIYALADAALVVNADRGRGGTWAGATEQLDQRRLVPVYVRSTGDVGEGLVALRERGALPWPNPVDADGLDAALRAAPPWAAAAEQHELAFEVREEAAGQAASPAGSRK